VKIQINPATGKIEIKPNNMMFDNRDNIISPPGSIIFTTILDVPNEVDTFKIPDLAGVPTATPAYSQLGGYMLYDSVHKDVYIWNGTSWDKEFGNMDGGTPESIYGGMFGVDGGGV
jgi:hypothetical protein